jgi:hypothetical protein
LILHGNNDGLVLEKDEVVDDIDKWMKKRIKKFNFI